MFVFILANQWKSNDNAHSEAVVTRPIPEDICSPDVVTVCVPCFNIPPILKLDMLNEMLPSCTAGIEGKTVGRDGCIVANENEEIKQ